MTFSPRNLIAGLAGAAALLLVACGGGGGGDDAPAPVADPPVAMVTASATSAPVGTVITLDGSGSTTPSGGKLSYQWSLPGTPDGSAAALSSTTDVSSSFTLDVPGEYVADLVVNDGRADSASARVTVTATNPDPVAVITPASQGVLLGATVTLDGSASQPPTGAAASGLHYQWALTELPDDSAAALSGATSAKATFTADQVGVFKATLVVTHGSRTSKTAETTVTVNTSNSAPVAALKLPADVTYTSKNEPILKAVRGQAIVLDGSASSDPDGDQLSYRWSFPSALPGSSAPIPRGSDPALSNAHSARATLVPDMAGTYYVDFTVYDASVAVTQRVIVQAAKPEGAANTPPEAIIGWGNALEYELGGWATVSAGQSYDIDGDPLTYAWTWWNTATPDDRHTAVGATGGSLNLGNKLPAGTYEARLVVNDGQEDSAPAYATFEIKIGANAAPDPITKVDIARVLVGETIIFDGSDSTDRNGDQLSYQWTLVDRPDGSKAVLQNATSAQARVVTDQPGVYAARLRVTDSRGAVSLPSVYDTVSAFAKAKNNPPVLAKWSVFGYRYSNPLPGQPLVLSLRGAGPTTVYLQAFDPDQDDPLYYIVTPVRQPASDFQSVSGETASGVGRAANLGTLRTPGEYEIEAIISDGLANSEPQRRSMTVVATAADYPTLLLETTTTGHDEVQVPSSDAFVQTFFPVVQLHGGTAFAYWYRLTAYDRDYTIADLTSSSTDSSLLPAFTGLQNGQVIRKGESVVFSWRRPLLPNEQELPQQLSEICAQYGSDSDECENERLRQSKLVTDYQFKGSFRIPEKEGYTFYIGD